MTITSIIYMMSTTISLGDHCVRYSNDRITLTAATPKNRNEEESPAIPLCLDGWRANYGSHYRLIILNNKIIEVYIRSRATIFCTCA